MKGKTNDQLEFPVCVVCHTYNQSAYITDTLDSFCMQQTSFPYVCVIMDDASTDGEQAIINDYLTSHFRLDDLENLRRGETDDYVMTLVQHRENSNCYFSVFYLKYNHWSCNKDKEPYYAEWNNMAKYIAMCEGDDYWTEPRKLQIQYDYLEAHPQIVLSCHRFSELDVLTGDVRVRVNPYLDQKKHRQESSFEFDLRFCLSSWVTQPLTLMVRKEAIKEDYYKGFKHARDSHFVYFVMKKGNGVCHAFIGGIYRRNVSTSIFGNLSEEEQVSINYKVNKDLAEGTGDPLIQRLADKALVVDCMNRLKHVSGGYYHAVKALYFLHRVIRYVRRGFSPCVPPISS